MTTAQISITPLPRSEPQAYAVPQPGRHLRLVPPAPQLSIDDIVDVAGAGRTRPGARGGGPGPAMHDALPPVDGFAETFFVAIAETMVGRRSVEQLSRHTSLGVQQWLRSLRTGAPGGRQQAATPRVRAVHVCHVRDGVVEATAVIQHGPHVRALNSRFVGLDRRWQCVQLQLV